MGERKQRPGSQKPGRIGPEVLGASLALPTPRMAYEIVSKSETPITCIGPPQEGPRPTGGARVHQPRGHPRAVVPTTGRHPPTNMPRQGHQGVTFYKSSTDTKGSGPDQVPRQGTDKVKVRPQDDRFPVVLGSRSWLRVGPGEECTDVTAHPQGAPAWMPHHLPHSPGGT